MILPRKDEQLSGDLARSFIKHGRKQYDLVTYPTASVRVPEAFYTIAELNEFIAKIEQRNTVAKLALV